MQLIKKYMGISQKMDVVFAIDKNFIQHFCVALTSLLETNSGIVGNIFLINNIEEKALLTRPFTFFKRKYNREIESLAFHKSLAKDFRTDGHITQATYYRLFLDEMLPEDVEKVLFLDADVIVNGNIDFFNQLDFQKQAMRQQELSQYLDPEWLLYAINNVSDQNRERLKTLGLRGDKYFNAGVLLINLRKWRANRISSKLQFVARSKKQELKLHDQDVLNIVLENEWKEIDGKFNAINLEYSGELKKMEDYSIIHFTNFPKPWHFINTHPFKKLYWIYLRKTPYKFYIPGDLTLKNFIALVISPKLKRLINKVLILRNKLLLKSNWKEWSSLNKKISN